MEPSGGRIRRAYNGKIDGAQIHILSFLGERWGGGSPRFSKEQVVSHSRKIASSGGVITWNTPVQRSGLIAKPFMDQLAAVGQAMGAR